MNHLAAIAATALFAAVWQGAILAALVVLTLHLLPAISAATRSLLWTVTFTLLVALHFVSALHTANLAATLPSHAFHVAPVWSIALATLWLLLSFFRAVQFLLGAQNLRRITRCAVPVPGDLYRTAGTALFESAMRGTALSRPYTLCISSDVDRPSVLGFFHPRILLPVGLLETLSPAELQQILLHETEHLRRSDDWTNLLQKLALVLFPLNPVLAWVERRLCLERELACDARVLSASENSRKSYATTLTRLAEHSILRRGFNLALGLFGKRSSELSTRVHRILARPSKSLNLTQSRIAVATVLASVLTLTTTLAHAPSFITFAPERSPALAKAEGTPRLVPEISPTGEPVMAKADLPAPSTQPPYRLISAVARTRSSRVTVLRPLSRRFVSPRVTNAAYRFGKDSVEATPPPRIVLTVATDAQVQQFVVPAVAYGSASYAAFRTSNGWIVFQL